jgi:ribose transport system ATP-binding protein
VLVFRENEVAAEITDEAMTTDSVISAMFGRAA